MEINNYDEILDQLNEAVQDDLDDLEPIIESEKDLQEDDFSFFQTALVALGLYLGTQYISELRKIAKKTKVPLKQTKAGKQKIANVQRYFSQTTNPIGQMNKFKSILNKSNMTKSQRMALLKTLSGMTSKAARTQIKVFNKLVKDGKSVSQITAELRRRQKNQLNKRAALIKTIEKTRIRELARYTSITQLKAGGYIPDKPVMVRWSSVNDSKTSEGCLSLDGEIVPLGQTFSNGLKAPPDMTVPHPCRSVLEYYVQDGNKLSHINI